MANSVLAKMAVEISANTAKFAQGINNVQGQFKNFTSSLTSLAGTVGIAFGVQQVADFAFEVSKLAGEAEGVRAAFDKLPESQKLMEDLKTATAGTVSELDLMKRTVQASNFGISLKALPDLLKFAAVRAQQTGQSVDYLVDSIVTGIGRKSPLILDNLGISAVRLKEQFGGAALEAQSIGDVAVAVGKIATEELAKMGDLSENASTKLQRLSANFDNLKVALGGSANSAGLFADGIDLANESVVKFTKFLEGKGGRVLEGYLKLVTLVPRTTLKLFNSGLDLVSTQTDEQKRLEWLNQRIDDNIAKRKDQKTAVKEYYDELYLKLIKAQSALDNAKDFSGTVGEIAQSEARQEIKDINDLIAIVARRLEEQKKLEAENQKLADTYETLQKKLKELNDQFEATDRNDTKKLSSIGAEIVATQKLIDELDKLRKARAAAAPKPNEAAILKGVNDQINKPISSLDPKFTTTRLNRGVRETVGLTDELLSQEVFDNMKNLEVQSTTTATKISAAFIDMSSIVGGALSELAFSFGQAAAGVGSFGDGILKALINFAKQFGEILIATGIAALAAKKLALAPGAAIAAGVALVAIAGAASAALSRAQANYNSGGGSGGSSVRNDRSSIGGLNGRGLEIQVVGELTVSNDGLRAAIKNADRQGQRTRLN